MMSIALSQKGKSKFTLAIFCPESLMHSSRVVKIVLWSLGSPSMTGRKSTGVLQINFLHPITPVWMLETSYLGLWLPIRLPRVCLPERVVVVLVSRRRITQRGEEKTWRCLSLFVCYWWMEESDFSCFQNLRLVECPRPVYSCCHPFMCRWRRISYFNQTHWMKWSISINGNNVQIYVVSNKLSDCVD